MTKAQMSALRWLDANGGLCVPNMNLHGKAREWPQKRTLDNLIKRGMVDFEQHTYEWSVMVNDAGRAALTSKSGE